MANLITPQIAAELLLARRHARQSMIEYVSYLDLGFLPARHHKLMCDKLDAVERGEIDKLMLFLPPGAAKALTLDTLIPTPSGWTTMGNISVGDMVFDENGDICSVVRKSEIYKDRPVYKITTDCGDVIKADVEHEWLVSMGGGGSTGGRDSFKLYKTHELAKVRSKRPMIQKAKKLQLPEIDLPIDPYILGLWLGDGRTQGVIITSAIEDQIFLRKEVEDLGLETRNQSVLTNWSIIGLRGKFVELGLIHDPIHNTYGYKHIPSTYLRASADQRLSLLQGLIDSDGTVSKVQGCSTFISTKFELASGVQELVRSLGVKASIVTGRAILNSKDCGDYYRVSFYLEGSARLPRKAIYTRNQSRTPNTYISCEYAGREDTVCITVNSKSHLFLCGESMTPTHNSKYSSELFPARYLGLNPTKAILACSHTQPLAERFGRRVRNLFSRPEHAALFNVNIAKDAQAASHWSTDQDGEYFAAGVGVAISGRRADLGLIDDPVKNREDADSLKSQEANWDWYINDFVPRLKPHAAQILIQTRWSEGDLAGRILDREASDWTVVEIPMEAYENDPLGRAIGERLWPEWFTEKQVETAKLDARSWSALYQQRPVSDEGEYFKLDWFRTEYEAIPDNAHYYGASDYAVTEGHGDFTEHGIFALDTFGNLYVVDWWRGQTTSDIWIESQLDLVQEYEPLRWFGESGPIRRAVEPYLANRMTQRNAPCYIEWLPSLNDKATRLCSFQALASRGKVFFPRYAPWKSELLTQLTHFPAGKHDDGVDVCSLIGRGLGIIQAPKMRRWTNSSSPLVDTSNELGWLGS